MPVFLEAAIVEKQGRLYRGKKRTEEDEEKLALSELQSILNSKYRKVCDCEAQVHDLLENCLNCGRLTCVAEGPGKCFHCSSIVLREDQRERFKKFIDIAQPSHSSQQVSRNARIKIVDNQFDEAAIENRRHLRDGDKKALKDSLNELQSKRYQRKMILNVDLANLEANAISAPVVEDYSSELRKLQIDDATAGPSARVQTTLVEVMEKQAKSDKQATNTRANTSGNKTKKASVNQKSKSEQEPVPNKQEKANTKNLKSNANKS